MFASFGEVGLVIFITTNEFKQWKKKSEPSKANFYDVDSLRKCKLFESYSTSQMDGATGIWFTVEMLIQSSTTRHTDMLFSALFPEWCMSWKKVFVSLIALNVKYF